MRFPIQLLTIICLVLGFQKILLPCSCIHAGSFYDSYTKYPASSYVKVKVVERIEYGIKAITMEVLAGKEVPDTLYIWGDPGFLCRGNFSSESEILVVGIGEIDYDINSHSPSSNYPEKIGDYSLGGCGTYLLAVDDDEVTGSIAEDVESLSLSDLKKVLNGDRSILQPVIIDITIYPNLVRKQTEMNLVNDFSTFGRSEIVIHNISGGEMYTTIIGEDTYYETIEIRGWPSGLYLVMQYQSGVLVGRGKFIVL